MKLRTKLTPAKGKLSIRKEVTVFPTLARAKKAVKAHAKRHGMDVDNYFHWIGFETAKRCPDIDHGCFDMYLTRLQRGGWKVTKRWYPKVDSLD